MVEYADSQPPPRDSGGQTCSGVWPGLSLPGPAPCQVILTARPVPSQPQEPALWNLAE